MKNPLSRAKRKERGSVAVEFAILLISVLIPLRVGALFFGRFFWRYTVAGKAAQDAARYIAAASPTQRKTPCTVFIFRKQCGVIAAMSLATKEITELNPGGVNSPDVDVLCDEKTCPTKKTGGAKTISVEIKMDVKDTVLTRLSSFLASSEDPLGFPITATVRRHYVGN